MRDNELEQLDNELEQFDNDEIESVSGKQNSSMAKLQREISYIISTTRKEDERRQKIRNKIENFPVPNTKEDLFEFTVSSLSKISDDNTYQSSYEAKYLECISKAEILFPNDPVFIGVAKKYKEVKKAIRKKEMRLWLFPLACFALSFILYYLFKVLDII